MSSKQEEPIHPALIATVIAWGAKFSEHPLLLADRQRNGGQSLLARTLVDRCREIAEATKVHRIPHKDHVVIALLIETMQCRECLHRSLLVAPHDHLFFGQKIRIQKMVSNRFTLLCHPLTDFECPRVSWILAQLCHPQFIGSPGRFSYTTGTPP